MGAILTVLGTAAAPPVDDGAEIYMVAPILLLNDTGSLFQLVKVTGLKEFEIIAAL